LSAGCRRDRADSRQAALDALNIQVNVCVVTPAASQSSPLSCSLKSRQRSSVGKPVVILGNGEVFLARLTNRLGRRSNAVPDDFINRFAGRTEIKVIVRCGRHGSRASCSTKSGPKRKGPAQWPAPKACSAFGNNRRRRGFPLADVLCRGRDARERQRHCRQ
jgi:hypothetical protein